MIVKGFKVLEASHKETQNKLNIAEGQLSIANASHETLIAAMEAAQQALHDRETVRQHIWRGSLLTKL
jgi:hypothetical protein